MENKATEKVTKNATQNVTNNATAQASEQTIEKVADNQATEPTNIMGTMPIPKLILHMSVPIMISMVVQACYNLVDSIFVSRIGENAFTAVSMAFPIQNLIIALAVGLGVGVTARLSKSLGERKFGRVNKIAMQGVFLALVSYVIFIFVGIFAARKFFMAQTDMADIVTSGVSYFRIICLFSFGVFFEVLFERLLQSTGKTMYSMITQMTGAIINIILDPIMIFGYFGMPAMGIAGAAYATVIGQIVAGALAVFLCVKVNKEIKLYISNLMPNWNIIWHILTVALPSIFLMAVGSITVFLVNGILFAFTPTAVAVFGAYFKAQSFIFMPVFGLNNGIIPIIAYNYGARAEARVRETINKGVLFSTIIMIIGMIICQIFGKEIFGLFNASEEMLSIGVPALRTISLSFVFAGFCILMGSVCEAFGVAIYTFYQTVARQIVVLVPAAYLLSRTGNLRAVWWAWPIAECASLAYSIWLTKKALKMIKD